MHFVAFVTEIVAFDVILFVFWKRGFGSFLYVTSILRSDFSVLASSDFTERVLFAVGCPLRLHLLVVARLIKVLRGAVGDIQRISPSRNSAVFLLSEVSSLLAEAGSPKSLMCMPVLVKLPGLQLETTVDFILGLSPARSKGRTRDS